MGASLTSLPQNLSYAYDEIMQRIGARGPDTRDFAYRILLWVFNAKRPMKMDELCELLSIKPGDKEICEKWCPKEDRVIDVCESLIVYDKSNGTARFTHYTVNEFLREQGQNYLPDVSYITDICITYLQFDVFSGNVVQTPEKYKARWYVAQSWGFHLRQTELAEVSQETVLDLLKSDGLRMSIWLLTWSLLPRPAVQTVLHFIAQEGLATICGLFLQRFGYISRAIPSRH
jgi:hypothetical protein